MSHNTIETKYRDLTPTSRQMFEDGRSVNAGAAKGAYYHAPYPITLRRGQGCELEDVDSRTYIDFSNHHTSQVLGHNHPAIQTQTNKWRTPYSYPFSIRVTSCLRD